MTHEATRRYLLERVGPAAVVQLYADGFDALPLDDKRLAWHLYEAALAGRDIYYDQRFALGLVLRDLLEAVYAHRHLLTEDVREAVARYVKLFWINSGPYEHITARKFTLALDRDLFRSSLQVLEARGVRLPLGPHDSVDEWVAHHARDLFDADWRPMVTSKNPGPDADILTASANNLYAGLTAAEADAFDEAFALNSRLARDQSGHLREEVYRVGERYGATLARVVRHLEAARAIAPEPTAHALDALIRFYRTGSDEDRRTADIAWLQDTSGRIDTINGFIEVYLDARGRKGAWEALVFYENGPKTEALRRIAGHAAWFEAHMPYDEAYRRAEVIGVTARAIDVVVEAGDAGPMTAIGINLPNDEAIRELHGSKSVSIANVIEAYEQSQPLSLREEFCWSVEELDRAVRLQSAASELATSLHEIIGHGSGRVAAHLDGNPQAALKEQYSSLEETRSDLVALYFIADPVMVHLGLVSAADHEALVLAEYEAYARNALVQLRRVRVGSQLEEDHMRNRQAIVHWLMAHTSAIERRWRDGRTFYVMVDNVAFREGVGRMLAIVQRIKSEGRYDDASELFETYGVHFDPSLRDEVVARVDRLDLPSYTGFVMPRLEPQVDAEGHIVDVQVSYPLDLAAQMLEYSSRYAMAPEDRQALAFSAAR